MPPQVYGVATHDPEEEWKASGLCRTEGEPSWWFPEGRDKRRQEQSAVAVCLRCPMLVRCKKSALDNKEIYGVWAAMTEDELRDLAGKKGAR